MSDFATVEEAISDIKAGKMVIRTLHIRKVRASMVGKTIVVTGKLGTFASRDELKECLTLAGATLTETLTAEADYLLTNTPNSGTAKNKKAEALGVKKITEAEFNRMIGRVPASDASFT